MKKLEAYTRFPFTLDKSGQIPVVNLYPEARTVHSNIKMFTRDRRGWLGKEISAHFIPSPRFVCSQNSSNPSEMKLTRQRWNRKLTESISNTFQHLHIIRVAPGSIATSFKLFWNWIRYISRRMMNFETLKGSIY